MLVPDARRRARPDTPLCLAADMKNAQLCCHPGALSIFGVFHISGQAETDTHNQQR